MKTLDILIIDDAETNLILFEALVSRFNGCAIHTFQNSALAIDWCAKRIPDLVLVDYMMPSPNGIEFIELLRRITGCEHVPVVMLTANHQTSIRHQALQVGATDFLTKPVDQKEFSARVGNMLELRRGQLAQQDRNAWLQVEVEKATVAIHEREQETALKLAKAAEYRDPETGAHILRMSRYARLIGDELGLPEAELNLLLEAAPMHDIGKVGTPDHILLKPGRLTPPEFEIMKQHASIGHEILKGSQSPMLLMAAEIALNHHEKFDGSGYPAGKQGTEIPLVGRIVAVADVFDALTSARPYKPAWSLEAALELLRKDRGSHFDPVCVDAFLARLADVLAIRARYHDDDYEHPLAISPVEIGRG